MIQQLEILQKKNDQNHNFECFVNNSSINPVGKHLVLPFSKGLLAITSSIDLKKSPIIILPLHLLYEPNPPSALINLHSASSPVNSLQTLTLSFSSSVFSIVWWTIKGSSNTMMCPVKSSGDVSPSFHLNTLNSFVSIFLFLHYNSKKAHFLINVVPHTASLTRDNLLCEVTHLENLNFGKNIKKHQIEKKSVGEQDG